MLLFGYCILLPCSKSSLGEMSNCLISSILKGSAKDIYLVALLSFVFFSISLKCKFFVFAFVDVLLCFYYVFQSYSGALMRIYSLKFEGAKLTLNFSHLMRLFSLWQSRA